MGPLANVRAVELVGMGPGPFCATLLADLGAEVLRIHRPGTAPYDFYDVNARGRRSVFLDAKHASGREAAFRLIERADVLIEGFRPGVMESLGLGPADCLARNPRLVYGRMTGWGQEGPMAQGAGHDINYIALSGALHAIGEAGGKPLPPLNLVGDFGGGGMLLAVGILAALVERAASGQGQVVDAAMVDGASLLMNMFHGLHAAGSFSFDRGTNSLDGGAPYYATYETSDGKWVAVGALEPQFYGELVTRLGIAGDVPDRADRASWPALRARLEAVFRTRTRDEWCEALEGTDACFGPVLSLEEVAGHPHAKARAAFIEVDGVIQPAPAPRFSRTPPGPVGGVSLPGADTATALVDWGFSAGELGQLRAAGAFG